MKPVERRFYRESNGKLKFRCICGVWIEDEEPETSLVFEAYRAEVECGVCNRHYKVILGGTLVVFGVPQ